MSKLQRFSFLMGDICFTHLIFWRIIYCIFKVLFFEVLCKFSLIINLFFVYVLVIFGILEFNYFLLLNLLFKFMTFCGKFREIFLNILYILMIILWAMFSLGWFGIWYVFLYFLYNCLLSYWYILFNIWISSLFFVYL